MKKTKITPPKTVSIPRPGHVLVLRICAADMISYNGFKWPESGPVSAPDWKATTACGNGLHGFLWGEGKGELASWDLDAKWLVVEVEEKTIIDLGGNVKFPAGVVVFCGDRLGATTFIQEHGAHGRAVVGGTATAGYRGTATAGYRGTATAGDRGTATAGYRGTATAGDRGTATVGDRGTATVGYSGTATVGYRGTATAGDSGTATAGDRGTATAGDSGTATAGDRGTATVGEKGILVIRYWDAIAERDRLAVGYVGEDGILPGKTYEVIDGKIVLKGGAK